MCSSFFGSLTLLNIEMRDQLGFSGEKKCEISWSERSICHLLHQTGCAAIDSGHHIVIVEMHYGIVSEK